MNNIIRTLIIYEHKDEAAAVRLLNELERRDIPARALSTALIKSLGFDPKNKASKFLDVDLSSYGISVKLVQVFCFYNSHDYKNNSDYFKKLMSKIRTECPDPKELGRGLVELTNEKRRGGVAGLGDWVENYLASCAKLYSHDPTLLAYQYDNSLSDACTELKPESSSEAVIEGLNDILVSLEEMASLLVPPYDERKFLLRSIRPITELLRGFETYGSGYDDPLVYALRVMIIEELCLVCVHKKAAEKYLADCKKSDDSAYKKAVFAWEKAFEEGEEASSDEPCLTALKLGDDADYMDLCRCHAAYKNAFSLLYTLRCPNLSEERHYGYDLNVINIITKLHGRIGSSVLPFSDDILHQRHETKEPGHTEEGRSEAEDEMLEACKELASHLLPFAISQLSHLERIDAQQLSCLRLLFARSAAFMETLGLHEQSKDMRHVMLEYEKARSGDQEPDKPATVTENALRGLLGCKLRSSFYGGYNVFISYKRKDEDPEQELPRKLYNGLATYADYPLVPFLDVVNLKSIGDPNYPRALDEAIEQSANLALLLTSIDDARSDWVYHEWVSFLWKAEHSRVKRKGTGLFVLLSRDMLTAEITEDDKKLGKEALSEADVIKLLPEFLRHSEVIWYNKDNISEAAIKLAQNLASQNSAADVQHE